MPYFTFKGRNSRGELITGTLEAGDAGLIADQLMNTGNIVEYSIRFFQRLDKKKHFVRGLLVGMSMRVVEQGDSFSSPKGGFLVLDHRYSQLALQELAPAIYLVDAEPTSIPELGT